MTNYNKDNCSGLDKMFPFSGGSLSQGYIFIQDFQDYRG